MFMLENVRMVAQLVKNPPAMRETWLQSLGRSPGEGNSYPLQYSGLENPHRGAWQPTVHEVAKSWIRLSDYHSVFTQEDK